jgi:hypothetical protein
MLPEADRVRLLHMRDAIREARRFIEGRRREDLDCDSMLLRALVNCLEVAGEAGGMMGSVQNLRETFVEEGAGFVVELRGALSVALAGQARRGVASQICSGS